MKVFIDYISGDGKQLPFNITLDTYYSPNWDCIINDCTMQLSCITNTHVSSNNGVSCGKGI